MRDEQTRAERAGDQESSRQTRQQPEPNADHDAGGLGGQRCHSRDGHQLQDEPGKQRADRVDQDALCLEDRLEPRSQPHVAQQRLDDGGTGHDHQRAEQGREIPAPAEHQPGQRGGANQRHQRAPRDQVADGGLLPFQAGPLEVEPTLEQDDRDTEVDDAEEPLAERPWVDSAEALRTEQRSAGQ